VFPTLINARHLVSIPGMIVELSANEKFKHSTVNRLPEQ